MSGIPNQPAPMLDLEGTADAMGMRHMQDNRVSRVEYAEMDAAAKNSGDEAFFRTSYRNSIGSEISIDFDDDDSFQDWYRAQLPPQKRRRQPKQKPMGASPWDPKPDLADDPLEPPPFAQALLDSDEDQSMDDGASDPDDLVPDVKIPMITVNPPYKRLLRKGGVYLGKEPTRVEFNDLKEFYRQHARTWFNQNHEGNSVRKDFFNKINDGNKKQYSGGSQLAVRYGILLGFLDFMNTHSQGNPMREPWFKMDHIMNAAEP